MSNIRIDTGEVVEIVEAGVSDAEGVLRHAREIVANDDYNVSTIEEMDITLEQEQNWIQKHIDSVGQIVLVAKTDGRVVGLATVENRPRKRIEHVGAITVSVDLKYRRKGIATALMGAAISWAENDAVVEKLGLSVFADNQIAIRLYDKMGFVEEGRRVKEVKRCHGCYIDDILMYRMVKDI